MHEVPPLAQPTRREGAPRYVREGGTSRRSGRTLKPQAPKFAISSERSSMRTLRLNT